MKKANRAWMDDKIANAMHTRDRNTCKMFEQIANHGCCRKGDNDQGLNETLRRLAVFAPSLPSPSSPLFPPCGDIRTVVSSIAELALQSQQQPMPLPNSRVCQTVCKSKLATTLEPFPLLSPPSPPPPPPPPSLHHNIRCFDNLRKYLHPT
ncbi:hypothetical protein XPA_008416 [Xanthoria parietina]